MLAQTSQSRHIRGTVVEHLPRLGNQRGAFYGQEFSSTTLRVGRHTLPNPRRRPRREWSATGFLSEGSILGNANGRSSGPRNPQVASVNRKILGDQPEQVHSGRSRAIGGSTPPIPTIEPSQSVAGSVERLKSPPGQQKSALPLSRAITPNASKVGVLRAQIACNVTRIPQSEAPSFNDGFPLRG